MFITYDVVTHQVQQSNGQVNDANVHDSLS